MELPSWQLLEELTANAWPGLITQLVDGWQVRFSWGVTRRANSVWPLHVGDEALLPQKLALVEAFYTRKQCPPCYKIPLVEPLLPLDNTLAERNYRISASTSMQAVHLNTLMAHTKIGSHLKVTVTEQLTDAWFDTYATAEAHPSHQATIRRQIMAHIGPICGYASVQLAGQIIAVGLGVVERGWLSLFNIVTQTTYRRQGAGLAVLRALAEWGQSHQAEQVSLGVMKNNKPALALYERCGFKPCYEYHYRVLNDG